MKTHATNHFLRLLFVALLVTAAVPSRAQEAGDFFTMSGTVRDARSGRPLPGANVMVADTRIGTVSNADGFFSLKVRRDLGAGEVEFSHLGYRLHRVAVGGRDRADLRIELSSTVIEIPEITVMNVEARRIVDEAVRRIGDNYSDRTTMLTGFYRETVQKRSNYIDIAEAVVEIFRTPYADAGGSDRIRIVKGRRLVSPRASDTLAVKLQGGPIIYFQGDVVDNPAQLLDPVLLDGYRFSLEPPAVIDQRAHHTVVFEPDMVFSDRALYSGRLYIDRETYTISRAEYTLDMNDRAKVSSMILRRKPASLRFIPQEVSYVLNYRRREGRSYLYYAGFRLRFRCDWRRRFFATGYTVSSEMVITDGRDAGVSPIPFRETFRSDQVLSDRVGDFHGPEFWEDYNIIEPTESLENAVDRLKRRLEVATPTE